MAKKHVGRGVCFICHRDSICSEFPLLVHSFMLDTRRIHGVKDPPTLFIFPALLYYLDASTIVNDSTADIRNDKVIQFI
jgi:hypothetical protein